MSNRLWILFLGLLWSMNGLALDDHKGELQFGLLSEISENANASKTIFELRSRFDYHSSLSPFLSSDLAVEALTQTGNVSFNFQERPGPRQGIRVRDAHFNVHDSKKKSQISLGVFDPNDSMAWPYLRPIAFPGGRLNLNLGNKKLGLKASVLQSIAASAVASRDVNENTENPRLTAESITLYARKRSWEADVQAFHFRFYDLPTQVAHLSRFDGNTVRGNNPQVTEYVYDFDGFGGSVYASTYLHKTWKAGFISAYMENIAAPAGINKGIENSLITDFQLMDGIRLKPQAGIFKKGSDVFPAYYLNNIQNMTNMEGQFARLFVEPDKRRWGLRFDYVQGQAIRPTPYQDDMQIIKLSWIQRYEVF